MLTPEQFLGFLLAAILVTAAPGPDNLMVLGVGISRGRRHGVAFGLGCATGCLSHTVLAVAGGSAAIAASPWAFKALRIAGGMYLVWLGLQAWRGRAGVPRSEIGAQDERLTRQFFKGVLANAINPKVLLFFLSFLPQFVDVTRGDLAWQMGLLGLTFTLQAAVLFSVLGLFSGSIGRWLLRKPRNALWLDRVAGAVFVALGVRLMTAH